MKRQFFSFTLLEIVLSVVLILTLLGVLFSHFRQTLVAKNKIALLKEKTLSFESLRLRLVQLFDNLENKEGSLTCEKTHPAASGPVLFFYCNPGIDHDPNFSGPLHHMLFKTQDQRLCLCSWSKNQVCRTTTLIDNVKQLSFAFFSEKRWHSQWPLDKSKQTFPDMFKITLLLETEEKERQLIFSPLTLTAIPYQKQINT